MNNNLYLFANFLLCPLNLSLIGLGYVGLPVAVAFGKHRPVIAFDINASRLNELRAGFDRTSEVSKEELQEANLLFTNNPDDLRQASVHIIAVPTPINEAKQPDLTPLLKATETIGKILKAGDLVIYESTVYPRMYRRRLCPCIGAAIGTEVLDRLG